MTATVPFDAIDILLGDHCTPNSGRHIFRQVTDSAIGNIEVPSSDITGISIFSYSRVLCDVVQYNLTHCTGPLGIPGLITPYVIMCAFLLPQGLGGVVTRGLPRPVLKRVETMLTLEVSYSHILGSH